MLKLNRVTITGADDSTDPRQMYDLSEEFPFVEWGILVSKGHVGGSPRFPSTEWIAKLTHVVEGPMQLATHMCGGWVTYLLLGNLDWESLPDVIHFSKRVQINTHSLVHGMHSELFLSNLAALRLVKGVDKDRTVIFQMDGVNEHLPYYTQLTPNIKTAVLFDKSAGAGIVPDSWPVINRHFMCGYAGGLSPDNVVAQFAKISAANSEAALGCYIDTWIDMERRVRTQDDLALDMGKVRKVLEQMRPFIG